MCFICCGSVSDLWWQCNNVTVWQCDTHQECLHHVSVLPLVSWLGLPLIALASVLQSRQRFRVLSQHVTECCHYICVRWCCDEQSGAGTEDESETWEGGGWGRGWGHHVHSQQSTHSNQLCTTRRPDKHPSTWRHVFLLLPDNPKSQWLYSYHHTNFCSDFSHFL